MNHNQFASWMDNTTNTLQTEYGNMAKIVMITDNAIWSNKFTPEAEQSKRAWKENLINCIDN